MKFSFSRFLGIFALLLSISLCEIRRAQEAEIAVFGILISAEGGLPIPGINVTVKGTTAGTATDFHVQCEIDIVPNAALT